MGCKVPRLGPSGKVALNPYVFYYDKSNLMTKRLLYSCLLLLMGVVGLEAQVLISYPKRAKEVTACLGQDTLWVRLDVASTTLSGASVRLNLPPGVAYVPGSVFRVNGSTGLTIAQSSITNLNNPSFSLNPNALVAGQFIEFGIVRSADCTARQHSLNGFSFKDSVIVNSSAGQQVEYDPNQNSYNLRYTSFILTPPAQHNGAEINGSYTRNFSVFNGGVGCSAAAQFYIVYPTGKVQQTALSLAGNPLSPIRTNRDTLFYSVSGAALGADQLFCNGEVLEFRETVKVLQCNPVITYAAGWGCDSTPAEWCQTVSGTGTFAMAAGAPVPALSLTVPQQVSWCRDGIVNMVYRNNGNGSNAGGMYNMLLQLGHNAGNTYANTPVKYFKVNIISASINGVSVTLSQSGTNPWEADLSQFTSDPDGVGGLADLDSDGQYDDLAPGAGFTLQFVERMVCDNACPMATYAFAIRSRVRFVDACGAQILTNNLVLVQPYYIYHTPTNSLSVLAPPQVASGQVIPIQACYTTQFNPPTYRPTDSLYLEVTLPVGARLNGATGNFVINGTLVALSAIEVLGQVVRVRRKGFSNPVCYTFEVVYDCRPGALGGSVPFNYKLYYVGDNACSCRENWACITRNVIVNCQDCVSEGAANGGPSIRRTTLGWTNQTLSAKVNPLSLSVQSLQRMAARDSFVLSMGAKEIINTPGGEYRNLFFYYQLDKAAGQNVLNFSDGRLFFKRGNNPARSCPVSLPQDLSTATSQRFQWDFSQLLGACLPSSLLNGDSVWVELRFGVTSVNDGLLYSRDLAVAPGQSAYFFNRNANNQAAFCGSWIPPLFVVGEIRFAVTYGNFNTSGCTSIQQDADYGAYYDVPFDVFPNEYRPFTKLDSIVVTLPVGYALTPGSVPKLLTTYWNTTTSVARLPDINLTPIVNGNRVVFRNPGTWTTSDMTYALNFARNRLIINVVPTCATPSGSAVAGRVEYFAQDYYYVLPNTSTRSGSDIFRITNNTNTRPRVELADLTGVVRGRSPGSWEVEIRNPSTQTAPYIWFAVEDSPVGEGIDVASVLQGATPLTALSYPGGKWYKVSTAGIPSGGTIKLKLNFSYTECAPDSLRVLAGWNCDGYPVSPSAYVCERIQRFLKADPQPSELQVYLSSQPADSIKLCEPFNVEIAFASTQTGPVYAPRVAVDLPAGVTISRVQAEYPLGSGNFETINGVQTGNRLLIDLTQHNGIDLNVPGTLTHPGVNDRQVRLRLQFNTTCEFVPGSKLNFRGLGNRDCGVPATGDNALVRSGSLLVKGTPRPYLAVITTNGNLDFKGCNSTQELNVKVILAGGQTTAQQAARTLIVLPAGIEYVSYVCASSNGSNCPGAPTVSSNAATGETLISFPYSGGIPQVAGESIDLKLVVRAQTEGDCASSLRYWVEQHFSADGLFCGLTQCPKMEFIAGDNDQGLMSIVKPTVGFRSLTAAYNDQGGGQYEFFYSGQFALRNDSDIPGTVLVDMYCLDANGQRTGSVLATHTFDLEGGISQAFSGSFVSTCNPVWGIIAVIRAGQCVCPLLSPAVIPRELRLIPQDCPTVSVGSPRADYCQGENVPVVASIMGVATGGAWRSLGTGVFANATALSTTYTPSPADRAAGQVTLIYGNVSSLCGTLSKMLVVNFTPVATVDAVADQVICNANLTGAINFTSPTAGVVFRWTNNNPTIGLPISGVGNIAAFSARNGSSSVIEAIITVTPELTRSGITCLGTPRTFRIRVLPSVYNNTEVEVCASTAFNLAGPLGGTNYQWTPSAGLSQPNSPTSSVPLGVLSTTEYILAYRTAGGCSGQYVVTVKPLNCTQPAMLGDHVWEDLNYNGIQESGEPSLGQVTVLLYQGTGSTVPVLSATTDGLGKYQFNNLPPGDYAIGVSPPAGFGISRQDVSGTTEELDSDLDPILKVSSFKPMMSGQQDLSFDIGLVRPVALGGTAWVDDGDGIQELGEPGLAGVKVQLYNAATQAPVVFNLFAQPIGARFSNANGRYTFDSIPPGSYYLVFDVRTAAQGALYSLTLPNRGLDDAKDSDATGSAGEGTIPATGFLPSGTRRSDLDVGFEVVPCRPFTCQQEIVVGLDGATCSRKILIRMIILGDIADPEGAGLVLSMQDQKGNAIANNVLTGAHVGKVKYVISTPNCPENTCWGEITVEDKNPPKLVSSDFNSTVLNCMDLRYVLNNYQSVGATNTRNSRVPKIPGVVSITDRLVGDSVLNRGIANFTACDPTCKITLTWEDRLEELSCDQTKISGLIARIYRTWTARDCKGMEASKEQVIAFRQPGINQFLWDKPASITTKALGYHAEVVYTGCTPDERVIKNTDVFPYVSSDVALNRKFYLYQQEFGCAYSYAVEDTKFPVCNGKALKIDRKIYIFDWCTGGIVDTMRVLIKIGDFTAPTVSKPTRPLVVSTTPLGCTSAVPVNIAGLKALGIDIADACSIVEASVRIKTQGRYEQEYQMDQIWRYVTYPVNNGYAIGLPIGRHRLIIQVQDACYNLKLDSLDFEVADRVAPVLKCDDQLNVSLINTQRRLQGYAKVLAEDIDEGSFDACSYLKWLRVRRNYNPRNLEDYLKLGYDTNADGAIDTLDGFDLDGDGKLESFGERFTLANGKLMTPLRGFVEFFCWDLAGDAIVELWAEDAYGNRSFCWMEILLDEKIPPVCSAPRDMRIWCDDKNLELLNDPQAAVAVFGDITIQTSDDCFDLTTSYEVVRKLKCGVGTIERIWTISKELVDGVLSSTCKQIIHVDPTREYDICFPKDVSSDCKTPIIDMVLTDELGCDILAVNVTDKRYDASDDECYKIFRTYIVIDWCAYDDRCGDPMAVGHIYVVDRATFDNYGKAAIYVLVRDEDRDGDEEFYLSENPSINEIKDLHLLGDTSPKNAYKSSLKATLPKCYDEYYHSFMYTQIIKVYDEERPVVTGIRDTFCTDPASCSASITKVVTIKDKCTDKVELERQMLMIAPFQTPDAGKMIMYATPRWSAKDLTGGKYEIKVSNLPEGLHDLIVVGRDECGNLSVPTRIPFVVKDCKSPAPICINGLSTELMPDGKGGGMMAVWASDFVASKIYDCNGQGTSSGDPSGRPLVTKYSINRVGSPVVATQTGLNLTCADAGKTILVELHAWDEAGNHDFCVTYIEVQDNRKVCGSIATLSEISGVITTYDLKPVLGVNIDLSGGAQMNQNTGSNGVYSFGNLNKGSDYTLSPQLDKDHINGVSTFDLVQIQKHILGVKAIENPYRLIAADVNNSHSITTIDMIQIRKLILNIDTKFSSVPSWKFVDASYKFPDPSNPWSAQFPEVANVNDLEGKVKADFIAIKMGDVNGNASASGAVAMETRSDKAMIVTTDEQQLQKGENYTIVFKSKDLAKIQGYQFTLNIDPSLATIEGLEYNGVMKADNFGIFSQNGMIATSFVRAPLAGALPLADAQTLAGAGASVQGQPQGLPLRGDDILFTLKLKAESNTALSRTLILNSRLTNQEAYNQSDEVMGVQLAFGAEAVADLHQNVPNPFSEETAINFYLFKATKAVLTIRDVKGALIYKVEGNYAKGNNQLILKQEQLRASGVMYYTLETSDFTATKKLVLLNK